MDLGLNALTDDQLLELVQQACVELTNRDPYVRNLGQIAITTEGQRLAVIREGIRQAVDALRGAYCEQISMESLEIVRRDVAAGRICLLTAKQEACAIRDATLVAKIKVLDETIAAIEAGKASAREPRSAMRAEEMAYEAARGEHEFRLQQTSGQAIRSPPRFRTQGRRAAP